MSSMVAEGLESRTVAPLDPDSPLVEASRNGDTSAFEELVKKYDRKLYRIAHGTVQNHEDAEEVVQTVFLKAHLNLQRFRGNAKFSTWLIRIAMNESFMKLRKQRSNKEQALHTQSSLCDEGTTQTQIDFSDWAMNPESLYGAAELREILEKCLQKLRPTLRVVFFLRDVEGHSVAETSNILNLTPTAVKTRLSRARLLLRQELTRYFKKGTEPNSRTTSPPLGLGKTASSASVPHLRNAYPAIRHATDSVFASHFTISLPSVTKTRPKRD